MQVKRASLTADTMNVSSMIGDYRELETIMLGGDINEVAARANMVAGILNDMEVYAIERML